MKKINGIRAITAICAAAFMLSACGKEESEGSTAVQNTRAEQSSGTWQSEGTQSSISTGKEGENSSSAASIQEAPASDNASNDSEQGLKTKEDSNMKEGLTERIQEIEKYCRVKLPDSYVIFIEEYNCGLPVANTFQTKGKNYVIRQFLGFVKDYKNSPLGEYDIAVAMAPIETYMTDNPDLVGCELIPIAVLTTDDYVCLDFKDNKEEPTVCIWSLVESEEFKPVTYPVADSFQEFVESLE